MTTLIRFQSVAGIGVEKRRSAILSLNHMFQDEKYILTNECTAYLLFQSICQGAQFFLQQEIFEVAFLLHFVDGFHKLVVQFITFSLRLRKKENNECRTNIKYTCECGSLQMMCYNYELRVRTKLERLRNISEYLTGIEPVTF